MQLTKSQEPLTINDPLDEGEWYMIQTTIGFAKTTKRTLVAQHVKTRDNDEEYPTFKVGMLHADPYTISVPRSAVIDRMVLASSVGALAHGGC